MPFATFSVIGLLLAAPPPTSSAKELNAEGFELYKKGDFQGAYAAFEQATRASPSLPIALYNRSALAVKTGHSFWLPTLLADLSASIEQDPSRLARARVDPDFEPIRTTLGFQRLIGAPDVHSVAGLTALLPKLSWWRASAEKYSIDASHTFRLRAGGRFDIEGQPSGAWRVVARPGRDPLVVIVVKEPAKTMTGELLPDGRLVFDDEWWTNTFLPGAPAWVEPTQTNSGDAAAQRLIGQALEEEQKSQYASVPLLLAAIDAAPRSARAYYELARVRGASADSCSDETSEGVSNLEAAFTLDPALRERAKTDTGIARLGRNFAYWPLMGADLRNPADLTALLPKLEWYFGPPSQSDMGWGLHYAFKPRGRFEFTERIVTENDLFTDQRVGTWKVARAGSGITVIIELPASKYAKAAQLVGRLTRDGRLLFESQWWRSGFAECCC